MRRNPVPMRVVDLAENLKVSVTDLVALLRAMGIPVPGGDAPVGDPDVARVTARIERERRSHGHRGAADVVHAVLEESQAPGKRRRRRAAEDDPLPPPVEEVEITAEAPEAPAAEAPAVEAAVVPEEVPSPVTGTGPESAAVSELPPPSVEAEEAATLAPPVGAEAPTEAPQSPVSEVEEVLLAPVADTLAPPPAAPAEEEGDPARPKRRLRVPEGQSAGTATPLISVKTLFPEAVKRPEPAPATPVERAAPAFRPTPAASAGPGGQVRIQADGFTADGQKKAKKKGKKRQRVDQDVVQDNIQRVMAEIKGGGKKRRKKGPSGPTREEREASEEERRQLREEEAKTVRVNEFLTVAELSELIDIPPNQLVGAAFKNLGLMITINQRLDFDQIELLLHEFNFKAVLEEDYSGSEEEDEEDEVDPSLLRSRPPVVTVMGHVDHGKTLLLDSIRKTDVAGGESGGITQHIGAYHVELGNGRAISFLDTPGHAAFTAMRARGADVTDIVVLVVAADDSVMPQTIEAISHAKNAGVPIVVAINKVDLPSSRPDKVKQELLQHGVTLEDFGGDVLSAQVSAKTGVGIEDLLEKILLQAEVLELRANPDREATGAVIEARLDVGKGPVVTVLIQAGTLRVGDPFICGKYEGKVRAMLDERGKQVQSVGPGLPVQILGSGGVPQAGDTLLVMEADRAGDIAQTRQRLEREKQLRIKERGVKLGDLAHFMRAGKAVTLPLLVKADVDGSVQAVADSLEQLSTSDVRVEIVHRAVGAINESDILLADTVGATVIAFRVRPDTNARTMAEQRGVEIHQYDVIYEAVDKITRAMEGLLSPEEREKILGVAEVREVFKVSKVGTIAGCYVTQGIIDRKGRVRLVRDHAVVYDGQIESLKRFKDDVREVRDGYECGIAIANFNDVKVGDIIECFLVEEIARTLAGSGSSGSNKD